MTPMKSHTQTAREVIERDVKQLECCIGLETKVVFEDGTANVKGIQITVFSPEGVTRELTLTDYTGNISVSYEDNGKDE